MAPRKPTDHQHSSMIFDLFDMPSSLVDVVDGGGLATCPQCGTEFKPRRKNMRFCKPNCRKAFSKPTQNAAESPTTARKNAQFFETARRMGDALYSLPIDQRLGHMQALIAEARAGNTQLREILSNYRLRRPHPEDERYLFPRSSRAYLTIAQAAQHYCQRFWKANVDDVVYDRAPEPPTGEVKTR